MNAQNSNNDFSKDLSRVVWHNNTMLILYIHGLNGSPSRVRSHLAKLQNKHPNALIISPKLPKKGNCSIYECEGYINVIIWTYRKRNPDNKIYVIGYSYGGKIAHLIEKDEGYNNIEFIYIATPFLGTRVMNMVKTLNLSKFTNFKPKVMNKLTYKKDKVLKFDAEVPKYFIYSDMDERIIPNNSCAPQTKNATYKCFPNYSHKALLHIVWDYIDSLIHV